eukprot:TRINITY_DN1341_c0_g1_i1.p1 TRINITY_DN1341_c0_g1~~TRINITY_DN1341_c0_g1_i1.p1  ORF type:complete len:726 (-),score=97.19 TRINITY_DN1341_c0_g1_i1:11973-14150(-)
MILQGQVFQVLLLSSHEQIFEDQVLNPPLTCPSFEKQLKNKLTQKTKMGVGEEGFLIRSFKFFDINNKGALPKEGFQKAIEKIGVTIEAEVRILLIQSFQDVAKLFEMYDIDKDGLIDYHEFAAMVFGHSETQPAPSAKKSEAQAYFCCSKNNRPEVTMDLIRKKVAARGARGILGLGKLFRIMDDNRSGKLDMEEFTKAMKEYKLGLDVSDIQEVFRYFDTDRSGEISYNEFLRAIRGEMNAFRKALVDQAFDRLDIDRSGVVDSSDIKGMYNPSKHPAVIEGRKTEDQILQEFLETFELHHNLRAKQEKDYKVTREEFYEYYNNISASIDNDEYFEVMIRNAWNLSDKPVAYKPQKPWAKDMGRPAATQRTGMESPESPLTRKKKEVQERKEEAKSPFKPYFEEAKASPAISIKARELEGTEMPRPVEAKARFGNTVATDLPKYQNIMLERFRTKLVARGGKGVIGMERQFRIFDMDGSGELSKDEFKKAINDYKLGMDERDVDNLFKMFDKNMDGKISYSEFMDTMVGSMSEFRRNMVERAFDNLDVAGEGAVELESLKKAYNARMHPDVKSGKKTEDEAANEFAITFDAHHNSYGAEGNMVTRDEFVSYYTKISAAVETDSYFDVMMTDTWGLGLRSNIDKLPYAGVSSKIYQVDSKAIWNYDHHKTMFTAEHPLKHPEELRGESRFGRSIYEMSEASKGAGVPSFPRTKSEAEGKKGYYS